MNGFKFQLANRVDFYKTYKLIDDCVAVSSKLDGIRAVYFRGSGKLLSRYFNEFVGFEPIVDQLEKLCVKNGLKWVDGELYVPSSVASFQRLSGLVRKKDLHKITAEESGIRNKISFHIHDKSCDSELYEPSFIRAFVKAMDSLDTSSLSRVEVVPQIVNKVFLSSQRNPIYPLYPTECLFHDNHPLKARLLDIMNDHLKMGYEGVMIKTAPAKGGRNNNLLKLKPADSIDATIVDFKAGKDSYEGMLGSLCCTAILNGKPITFYVSSGLTIEERDEIWRNRDSYVGRRVEVKYMEATSDGKSLRHPIFKCFIGDVYRWTTQKK